MTGGQRARYVAVAGLLAAAVLAWAGLPLAGASGLAKPTLAIGICCAAGGLARLWFAGTGDDLAVRPADLYEPLPVRMWQRLVSQAATVPWQQLLIVAVLAVEAMHHGRPWHTVVLGIVLLGYLFAVHLAESAARADVFRPVLPFVAAGLALAVLSGAASALPAGTAGIGAGWVAALAGVAAVVAVALALPV